MIGGKGRMVGICSERDCESLCVSVPAVGDRMGIARGAGDTVSTGGRVDQPQALHVVLDVMDQGG